MSEWHGYTIHWAQSAKPTLHRHASTHRFISALRVFYVSSSALHQIQYLQVHDLPHVMLMTMTRLKPEYIQADTYGYDSNDQLPC